MLTVGRRGRRPTDPEAGPRDDEAELIARVKAGEREAETELYQQHRRQVAGNLYRVLGRQDDLEDLVQEVFVIAFRGLERFRGDARLSTWLYRIAVNVALGNIRKRKRRPRPLPLPESVEREIRDPAPSPYRQVVGEEYRELCYRVMETLSPKKRLVLYLHEIEGHDLVEIAEIVGAHPVTVRTRLFYARKEFHSRAARELERMELAADGESAT